jgi:hypothetical protein
MVGSETYIPAKDYFTKLEAPVDWQYAFQRQWLFYKLWGRLLYNPDTPDAVFRDAFVQHPPPRPRRLQHDKTNDQAIHAEVEEEKRHSTGEDSRLRTSHLNSNI